MIRLFFNRAKLASPLSLFCSRVPKHCQGSDSFMALEIDFRRVKIWIFDRIFGQQILH